MEVWDELKMRSPHYGKQGWVLGPYLSQGRVRECLPDNGKNAILRLVSTPAEIENAIEKLPTEQLLEVAAWLDDYRAMIQSSESLFENLDAEEADFAGQQWLGE